LAGLKFACEAMFTLFDKDNDAQVYKRPGSEVPGGLIYVGRGCNDADYSVFLASPADVAGKIVVRDRNAVASRQTNPGFCSAAASVKQAQDRGAKGVIINQTSTGAPQAFSFDGDPTGLSIPAYMIDKSDGDALRDALCPDDADNGCGPGGQTITGAMRDTPGDWGALRVFDLSDPAKLTERGVYRSPTSIGLPPDVGVYGVHHAVADGSTAYVAAHSDGVRVVDLSTANPTETGSFVPADISDPSLNGILPAKAMVTGTDVGPNGTIVITDINSGLYVLRVTPEPGPQNPGPQNPGPSPGGDGGADGPRVRPNLVRPQASALQTGGRGGASRSAVARMSQSGSRIVVRVRGRMLGNRGRACGGRIKIGTRAGRTKAATRTGRMGRNCRYSARYSFPARRLPKRLRPRKRTLVLSILVRYQGNSQLRGDLSPPRRVKVRR